MIEIEKGIPVPNAFDRKGYSSAMMALEPGDSFAVPYEQRSAIRSLMSRLNNAHPDRLWTTRRQGDTIRVWRSR